MPNTRHAELGKKLFTERRDAVIVVAVLIASITYTAGLSPPGGLWQDDLNGHQAGSSILRDISPDRYANFSYANGTAFITSLILIVLIMNEGVSDHWARIKLMYSIMLLSLVSLIIAYCVGCERRLSSTSVYLIGLASVFFLFVFTDYLVQLRIIFFPTAHSPPDQELVQQGVNPEITRCSSV